MKPTIFICGGHVTPALALIEELTKRDARIVFAGRKYALEGSRQVSEEYRLVHDKRVQFLSLTAGRLQRKFTWQTIPSLLKIPVGLIQALFYTIRFHPAVIVSFGGYVALPVSLAGATLGIPVITHEQTRVIGLSNRIIGRIAKKICVTFPEMLKGISKEKGVYTGLPIRREMFTPPSTASYRFPDRPLLYIAGGSLGAKSLNDIVFQAIPKLTDTFTILHQVGRVNMEKATEVSHALSDKTERYIPVPYLSVNDLSWVLSRAAIYVGRSGANTVVELAALGKIAILVPLPWAAGNEQYVNAKWLEDNGGAMIVPQDSLTPESLVEHILSVWKDRQTYEKRAKKFSSLVPRDGARSMSTEVLSLIGR